MEDFKSKSEIAESSTVNRQSSASLSILTYSKLTASNKEYFKSLFEKYDRNGNGTIDVGELATMLRDNNEVSDKLLRKLFACSDRNSDGKVDVNEFTAMMLNKNFKDLFGNYVNGYVDFLIPKDKRHKFRKVGRSAAHLEAGETEVDGGVLPPGSCWPPPLCMVLVAIIEIICYTLNEHLSRDEKFLVPDVEGEVAKLFIYDPEKRKECWRFLTYMLVHIGWSHLLVNLVVQIFLGIPLEFRNRWYRVFTVYAAGVIAGSLFTSITDPTVYLAGASGGVYAIITAHLANLLLNWHDVSYPWVQLVIFGIIIICDVVSSVYSRHSVGDSAPIGYAAHFGGALAGFLVGIWVLKNVEPTEKERYIWWAAFIIYVLLMITAILLNIFWKSHFL